MFDSRSSETNQESLISSPRLLAIQSILGIFFSYILLYFLCRCLFLAWNWSQLSSLGASQIAYAFLNGLRFDFVLIGPLVFFLSIAAALKPAWFRWICFMTIVFLSVALFFINFVDIELLNFTGRRFTRSSLFLASEGQTTNLLHYKFLTIMTFIGLSSLIFVSFFWFKKMVASFTSLRLRFKILGFFFMMFISVVMIRGGFQYKPISYVDAKLIDHPYAHQLVLNSGFTFLKSWGQKTFQRERYFSDQEMLGYLNLNPQLVKSNIVITPQKLNVVIFIVESLSAEYISKEHTPFFLKLADQGVYFDRAYANGRRSIEGIASILSGIPAMMEEPFLNSEFATNEFVGLGHLFKNNRYQTSFFHGAQNGSMRFDVFTKASGFDDYYGKQQYPNSNDDDGSWGIFDGPFFQFQCDQMSKTQQPFASVIFTLSTHQPFKVPTEFEKTYQAASTNEHAILKSFRYFDDSLEKYFNCAKKHDWFNNTLFIFVADHTGPSLDEAKTTFKSKFEIPILFYTPQETILKNMDRQQYAQQIDLLPTLNDLFDLGLKTKNHLARSLLQSGQKTIALYSDQHYELVGDTELSENHLKAIRQYFSEGLYDNRLYFPQVLGK